MKVVEPTTMLLFVSCLSALPASSQDHSPSTAQILKEVNHHRLKPVAYPSTKVD